MKLHINALITFLGWFKDLTKASLNDALLRWLTFETQFNDHLLFDLIEKIRPFALVLVYYTSTITDTYLYIVSPTNELISFIEICSS